MVTAAANCCDMGWGRMWGVGVHTFSLRTDLPGSTHGMECSPCRKLQVNLITDFLAYIRCWSWL